MSVVAIFRSRDKNYPERSAPLKYPGPPWKIRLSCLPAGKRGRWINRAITSLLAWKAQPRRFFAAPRAAGAALPRPAGWRLALLHAASAAQALALPPLVEKLGRLHRALGDRQRVFRPIPRAALAAIAAPTRAARRASIRGAVSQSLATRHRPYLRAGNSAKPHPRSQPPQNSARACRRPRVRAALPDLAEMSGFAGSLLRRIDLCSAQTNSDAQRYAKLGMRKVEMTGNLKYDFVPAPVDQSALARLLARIGTRPAWVAAGVIFAGKSLRHRGKNPVEAARLGCAILHGPDVAARWYLTTKRLPSNWRSSSLTKPNCGQWPARPRGASTRTMQAIEPFLAHGRDGECPPQTSFSSQARGTFASAKTEKENVRDGAFDAPVMDAGKSKSIELIMAWHKYFQVLTCA